MASAKTSATVDTTAGSAAYALALQHKPQIGPRLPAGTLDGLANDLTTLGAPPPPPDAPPLSPGGPPPAPPPPAAPPPSLADAMAAVITLLTAFHEALATAKVKPSVRKAYGVSGKTPTKSVKALLADAQKLVTQAHANPAEALSLGILPDDIASLEAALNDLLAAESAAKGPMAKAGGNGAAKHAAAVRMREVTARIAGVGVLAFATNPAVRAQFEALLPKKS